MGFCQAGFQGKLKLGNIKICHMIKPDGGNDMNKL